MHVRKPNHGLPLTSDRAIQNFYQSMENWAAGRETDLGEEFLKEEVFIC